MQPEKKAKFNSNFEFNTMLFSDSSDNITISGIAMGSDAQRHKNPWRHKRHQALHNLSRCPDLSSLLKPWKASWVP